MAGEKIPPHLLRPKDWIAWSIIALEYGIMVGSALVAENMASGVNQWLARVVAVLLIGNRMFVVGEELFHEASHFKMFSKRRLNSLVGNLLLGLPYCNDFFKYHEEHTLHHRTPLAQADSLSEDYRNWGLYDRSMSFFYVYFGRCLWFPQYDHARRVFRQMREDAVYTAKVFSVWAVMFAACWACGVPDYFFTYWLVPLFLVHPVFLFWSEIEDHFNSKSGTRSIFSFNPFMYPYNSGYHYAHHIYPHVPWYNIIQVHELLCKGKGDEAEGFMDAYHQMAPRDQPFPPSATAKQE